MLEHGVRLCVLTDRRDASQRALHVDKLHVEHIVAPSLTLEIVFYFVGLFAANVKVPIGNVVLYPR